MLKNCNPKISVIFPVYNEINYLEKAVKKVINHIESLETSFEIIIAEDGSSDGTDKVAKRLCERYDYVKHVHWKRRIGRGAALKAAFEYSKGKIIVYMDVDLATNLKHLKPLITAVSLEGYDFAIGSRMFKESRVERPFKRTLSSKTYNLMVRTMLGSKLKDHQCGFKAFRRESVLNLLNDVGAKHWFWDTEILVRAIRRGYKVKEIPVEWKSGTRTKVNLFKDSFSMGKQVVKLYWKLKSESDFFSNLKFREKNYFLTA